MYIFANIRDRIFLSSLLLNDAEINPIYIIKNPTFRTGYIPGRRRVQNGTTILKGVKVMEFKDFFTLMKPVLGKERANSKLVRNLVAMITKTDSDVDPSQNQSDDTLKSYSNGRRPLSPEYARGIIAEVEFQNFVDSVNSNDEVVIERLSDSFKQYDSTVTPDVVGTVAGEIFLDILYKAAGENVNKQKSIVPSKYYLRHRYGNQLLVENKGSCSYKGCGKPLVLSNNESTQAYFDVVMINNDDGEQIDNLIALCPECAGKYLLSHSEEDQEELHDLKATMHELLLTRKSLTDIKIEESVSEILEIICETDPKEITNLSYEPKSVRDKIYKKNYLLFRSNIANVTQYYPFIETQFKSFSREKKMNYERLSMQIRSAYLTAAEKTSLQDEIYTSLVEWLMDVTRKPRVSCEIVISFFVQKCEVFDVPTKQTI